MNVLVACEESQEVCFQFRLLGHNCYSCDLVDCSGGFPEWHIICDCLTLINGHCSFVTSDGLSHYVEQWDLIIAHPPCTFLSRAGNRWFNKIYPDSISRYMERDLAAEFFLRFFDVSCQHIVVENPVGYMSNFYRFPDQIIEPWQFGDPYRKATCLWLKNLPQLQPTKIVVPLEDIIGGKVYNPLMFAALHEDSNSRRRLRSKTYPGIAQALAKQYSDCILSGENFYNNEVMYFD